jgi:aconitate hydratase
VRALEWRKASKICGKEFGELDKEKKTAVKASKGNYDMGHGDVVIAAITSCTNTSNPYVMMAAGLGRAKSAVRRALSPSRG